MSPQTIAFIERLCEIQHDAYEAAASEIGWSTNLASRKPWSEVPAANQNTMRRSMYAVLAALWNTDSSDVTDAMMDAHNTLRGGPPDRLGEPSDLEVDPLAGIDNG